MVACRLASTQLDIATVGCGAATTQAPAGNPEDRFLKLLVAQLNNQDPMNPMDNAQMTTPDGADQHGRRACQQVNESARRRSASQFTSMQVLQAHRHGWPRGADRRATPLTSDAGRLGKRRTQPGCRRRRRSSVDVRSRRWPGAGHHRPRRARPPDATASSWNASRLHRHGTARASRVHRQQRWQAGHAPRTLRARHRCTGLDNGANGISLALRSGATAPAYDTIQAHSLTTRIRGHHHGFPNRSIRSERLQQKPGRHWQQHRQRQHRWA